MAAGIAAGLAILLAIGGGTYALVRSMSGGSAITTEQTGATGADTKGVNKPCATPPKLTPSDASGSASSGELTITAKVSPGCKTGEYADKDVEITLKDDAGVILDGVFDFTDHPVDVTTTTLSFTYPSDGQWAVALTGDDLKGMTIDVKTGVEPVGQPISTTDSDVIPGANAPTPSSADRELYAKAAIARQIAHDKTAADALKGSYTAQLVSRKVGLEAEGRTWSAYDIWFEYVGLKNNYPSAVIVDSSDYANYTDHGSGGWWVVLTGDSYPDRSGAQAWCDQSGRGADGCLAVGLR